MEQKHGSYPETPTLRTKHSRIQGKNETTLISTTSSDPWTPVLQATSKSKHHTKGRDIAQRSQQASHSKPFAIVA